MRELEEMHQEEEKLRGEQDRMKAQFQQVGGRPGGGGRMKAQLQQVGGRPGGGRGGQSRMKAQLQQVGGRPRGVHNPFPLLPVALGERLLLPVTLNPEPTHPPRRRSTKRTAAVAAARTW